MRVKHFFPIAILFFIGFYACNSSNGYKKAENGLEYKFITEAKGDVKVKEGEVVELVLKYFGPNDSILFDSKEIPQKFRIKIEGKSSHKGGSFEDAIQMMKVGDSAQFLINADSFFIKTRRMEVPKDIKPGDKLRFDIKIIGTQTEEEVTAERMKLMQEQEAEEVKLFAEYLKTNNITQTPTASGLYIIQLEKGNGKKIEAGQTAVVHYSGTLLNGFEFDTSIGKEPFTFPLGQQRVIPAWDEAVATMKIGDKIKIIAPSKLAYGPRGAGGVIPPFAPLVFEIKLMEIK